MLAKALNIAYSAHQGQIDKGGIPYIQHPIRVALNCLTDDEKIVALLHDVIEDTSVTVEELINEGFNQNIIDAIISLTKKNGEDYMTFIRRVSSNELATLVKIQDLKTLSKILCKWEQDSVVGFFLYLDSVFKDKHKLVHNQSPV